MHGDSIFKNQEIARVNKISVAEGAVGRGREDQIFKSSRNEKVE
jgi:hypothetical protein